MNFIANSSMCRTVHFTALLDLLNKWKLLDIFCRKGLHLLTAQPARLLIIYVFMVLLIGNGVP